MKQALTASEIKEVLQSIPGWTLQDGKLTREWTFKDFVQAMEFVNQLATLAETAQHHPDIDIRYNRVRLGLISHDAGGVTQRDSAMAKQINQSLRNS
jgi:4a-hydroxytetrahydrobiopterin dehydratase